MKRIYTGIFVVALCLLSAISYAQIDTFYYTGSEKYIIIPPGSCIDSVSIDMGGAQGGGGDVYYDNPGTNGGYGGRVQATIPVNIGDSLFIRVGAQGQTANSYSGGAGGYNGGGTGDNAFGDYSGGGGGGGSDVRVNGHTLANRVVVAGGGGGGGYDCSYSSEFGAAGGGLSGATGGHCSNVGYGGGGGTQFGGGPGEPGFYSYGAGGNGVLGIGGDGGSGSAGGGGGGGYYGGGGGCWGGAGGGSGYTEPSAAGVIQTTGYQPGNGYVIITLHSVVKVSTTQVNLVCPQDNNGSINTIVSGGTPPYTYLWSNGQTTANVTGLTLGAYTVTVNDNGGCSTSVVDYITGPPALTSIDSIVDEVCHGDHTGYAKATATGGKPPYTYSWSPGGSTANFKSGLSAGTYTLNITDACGTSYPDHVVITQPFALVGNLSSFGITCQGDSDGIASILVVGGTTPYSYNWMPGNVNNPTDANLKAGTYTITTTDARGCSIVDSVKVTQPAPLTVSWGPINNPKCYGDANGSVHIIANGSTPYIYKWTPQEGDSARAVNLVAGTYIVSVTDNCGYTAYDTVTLTQPPALHVSVGISVQNGLCQNTLWANATGGSPVYNYMWSPGGQNTDTIKNQCQGEYTVFVTDNNGCMDSAVDGFAVTGINAVTNSKGINLYPVPTKATLNIDLKDNSYGFTSLAVYDVTGREVMQQNMDINTTHIGLNVSGFDNGIYMLKLISEHGEKNIRFEISK